MYLERRITAAIHGEPEFDFSAIIGWSALGMFILTQSMLLTNDFGRDRGRCGTFWQGS